MKKVWTIILLSLFMLPGASFAEEASNYGAVKLGYFMPNDDDDGLKDFDNTFGFGVTYGRKINSQVTVEAGFEYYAPEYSESYYDSDYDLTEKMKVELTVWAIPITGKYLIPFSNEVTGFIGAGIGFYMFDVSSDFSMSIPGYTPVTTSASDSGNCFGFHIAAGADYAVTPNVLLGVELKWNKAEGNIKLKYDDIASIEIEEISFDDYNIGGTTINVVGKMLF